MMRGRGGSACLLSVLLICVGCSGNSSKSNFSVFVSGDTSGWITPCGCTSNQSGGLSRRDTLLTDHRRDGDVLALDVGGNVSGDSAYDLSKLRFIVRGLNAMEYDAVNLGGPESQFSPDEIREVFSEVDAPLLSTNVTDSAGIPLGERHVMLRAGGRSIGVLGVVDPTLVGADLSAADPSSAILTELPKMEADVTVVLAYTDTKGLRELATKLPEVDAVIGGPTGQVIKPSQVGSVWVASATNKGKFLLRWDVGAEKPGEPSLASPSIVEVDSSIEMAARQQDNLEAFYGSLSESDFSPQETTFVSSRLRRTGRNRIAGSEACVNCHQVDDAVWHDSKHIHAWASLQQTGAQVDPACQRCHTTGYGRDGGFFSHRESTELVNVGCENCHGPSSEHVARPTVKTPYEARAQCIQCHDHENSPTFEYDAFWKKITHGPMVPQE